MINKIILGDCFDVLKNIPDGSVNAVITDPPYKYLNHKLETDWDEKLFFTQCFRVLKNNSYLVFFGKGISFFRWCVIAEKSGFVFKEDIIWDKIRASNPLCDIPRSHECIAIFAKGNPRFNEVRIDKITYDLQGNPSAIISDIKRIITSLKSVKSYEELVEFRKGSLFDGSRHKKPGVSITSPVKDIDRGSATFNALDQGRRFPTVYRHSLNNRNRNHPTEKPVILLKDLIKLTTNEGDTILDPFCGSGTTAIACKELGRNYICVEKEPEYYQIACNRINQPIADDFEQEYPDLIVKDELPQVQQLSLF